MSSSLYTSRTKRSVFVDWWLFAASGSVLQNTDKKPERPAGIFSSGPFESITARVFQPSERETALTIRDNQSLPTCRSNSTTDLCVSSHQRFSYPRLCRWHFFVFLRAKGNVVGVKCLTTVSCY